MRIDAGPIHAVVGGLVPPFAMAAVGIRTGSGPALYHVATAPGIVATAATMFRTASISKIVTGQTLASVTVDLEQDIGAVLGFPLRNPAYPDLPITLAHLLGHSSGLTDAAGYAVPAGMRLQDWLARTGSGVFGFHPPGAQAEYCNLGYMLAAAAAEVLGGARFDHLAARHVLGPLGITAGFNWSGVPEASRQDRLAIHRRDRTRLIAQIDAVVAASGPSGTDGREIALDHYTLGQHTAAFSPQGGLRMSLSGCLTLARALSGMDQIPLWTGDPGANPVFDHYGAGLQFFRSPAFYPGPLIGHFANAYGFAGGVWHDADRDLSFCYGLNGLPMGDDSDGLRPEELAIFDAIAHSGA